MRIELDPKLTLEQNAAVYFERAKKARKKLEGARKALISSKEKRDARPAEKKETRVASAPVRKPEWYEKFRWFISSEGFLCIGGRDASTNEIIVKRHTESHDIVFHTDMAGSPFVVVKAEGGSPGEQTLAEAAIFTGCYSRAWKKGMTTIEVFYVNPDQVTKHAQPGEYLPKGAFMIRGQTNYLQPRLEICIGKISDGKIMIAPQSAIEEHCLEGFIVRQGGEKASDVAKQLAKRLECHPDEVLRLLPPGGVSLGVKVLGKRARSRGLQD